VSDDTAIGGPAHWFPVTRWSVVLRARSDDPADRARALEIIIAAYWKPVYKYIRAHWGRSNEDAKDLTQEFFARLIEKGFLESYDPAKARLRTFLRTCVDAVVANQDRAARRVKRGGEASFLALDFEAAEHELALAGLPASSALQAPETLEEYFAREWVRSLLSLAVDELHKQCEAHGKAVHFQLFERYDIDEPGGERPTYESLARAFGLAVTDVTNHLAFARREFRRIALEKLREVTASEEEFRREARSLFGVEPE